MADKERVQKRYAKVREKNPQVTDKAELDLLAMKLDQKITLLKALGFLGGALAMFAFGLFARWSIPDGDSQYYSYFCAVFMFFESINIFSKYSRSEKLFRPVLNIEYEGCLTAAKIMQDGEKELRSSNGAFVLYRLPLVDIEEEVKDTAFLYPIKRQYFLKFFNPETGQPLSYKGKADTYMNSVIGTEYYVAVTPYGKVAAIYQATNWSIDPALKPYFRLPGDAEQSSLLQQPGYVRYNCKVPDYIPSQVYVDPQPQKTEMTFPITAIVLLAVSLFTPAIIGIPATVAAIAIAGVALAKQRSKLSIATFIASLVAGAIILIGVILMM